ncbi:MAG: deoxyribonuclease IV [Gemmatimonadetes bacterium]|nr:deoxyribonuclease IV [Gemmatimonadota bacterium]
MSIAGGVPRALERGLAAGCGAVQIFTKNNNRWDGKAISEEDARSFLALAREFPPGALFSHSSYLINLGAPRGETRTRSIRAMVDELERAERLALLGVVLHPGSHVGAGVATGIRRIAGGLNRALRATAGFETLVLLETTAGQGSNLGRRFEEIARIIDRVREPERIGVCLDTCHVFAAGYPIQERDGYEETMDAFDRLIGLDRLKALHLNDSKMPFGSRRDRHEHIGRGEMGIEPFRFVMNDARLARIPMVLETPKDGKKRGVADDHTQDRRNLAVLRGLRER